MLLVISTAQSTNKQLRRQWVFCVALANRLLPLVLLGFLRLPALMLLGCTLILCLQDMLKSFASSEYGTQFHQTYYTLLMREVFAVMTDTFHTPGFKLHCKILLHLFSLVRSDAVIKAPLWDVAVSCAAATLG